MATKANTRTDGWGRTLLLIGTLVFMAAWALIPVSVLETTWQAEQQQMASWSGIATHDWLMAKVSGLTGSVNTGISRWTGVLGASAVEAWLAERAYATILWLGLAVYRSQALVLWSLVGIPVILAATIDGFFVREIRKTSFVSQSPIRHKIGVMFFRWVVVAVTVWLLLPTPAPIVFIPGALLFVAASLWLWTANLQKRI